MRSLTLVVLLALVPSACGAAVDAPRAAPRYRELPFEITSNKPWVQVRVNGSEPQWFILDTGCSVGSLIARGCAERIGLRTGDETPTRMGAGEGVRVGFSTVHDVTLEVGGDTLGSAEVGVIPMEHIEPYEGRRLDGLLGEDFMERHVVEIDYAHRRIRVHPPESYRYLGATAPIPITLEHGLAVAEAEMTPPGHAPIRCRVVIDTGVRSTVIWYHPFVVAHALLAGQPRLFSGTIGGGAGGETRGDIGRLDRLRIGPVTIERPTAIFSSDTSGVFASREMDGIVGGELLRRCKVTFDYPHRRLMLEPYREGLSGFDYDMSGLFLVAERPDFRRVTVQSVAEHTPAREAGIEKGDELLSVDGRPVAAMSLDEVRDLFRVAGTARRLEIRRGERRLEVRLVPRRLV